MIKITGDEIFIEGEKVGEITVGTSTIRDKFTDIITGEIEREPEVMELVLQCPECLTDFEEEVTV